jgi:hypothetical protein
MEPTQEESRLQRKIWDLRASEAFLEGDSRVVQHVRELETELERSRWDNKTPNERFEQKIEEALDG